MIVQRREDGGGQYRVIDRQFQGSVGRVWILWKQVVVGRWWPERPRVIFWFPAQLPSKLCLANKTIHRRESPGRTKCMFHAILRLHCICDTAQSKNLSQILI